MLVNDESFKGRDSEIVDECLTFFLAGSQTTKTANTNLLIYATMDKEVKERLIQELKEKVIKDKTSNGVFDVAHMFEYEDVMDLSYY